MRQAAIESCYILLSGGISLKSTNFSIMSCLGALKLALMGLLTKVVVKSYALANDYKHLE